MRISSFSSSETGFTLIEMLVSISVAAIIGAVGFASYTSYASRQAIRNAAEDIKTTIDKAKNNAGAKVKPVACSSSDPLMKYMVTISPDPNNKYELGYLCGVTYGVYNSESTVLKNGIIISSLSTCRTIEFFSLSVGAILNGSSSNTSCTIVLKDAGRQIPLTVDSNGAVIIPR